MQGVGFNVEGSGVRVEITGAGLYKTIEARFWPWISGQDHQQNFSCSRFALQRHRKVAGLEGFKVQGAGCRVQGSGFRVQGSGFRVHGVRVQGAGLALLPRHHMLIAPPHPPVTPSNNFLTF